MVPGRCATQLYIAHRLRREADGCDGDGRCARHTPFMADTLRAVADAFEVRLRVYRPDSRPCRVLSSLQSCLRSTGAALGVPLPVSAIVVMSVRRCLTCAPLFRPGSSHLLALCSPWWLRS